ncbi:hypothetical protein F4808DRAFT_23065 [Astrocystis sublimbata]|nr:hypothetical protein F4808DRAFT_23065 [Astrocystis sublimbata]
MKFSNALVGLAALTHSINAVAVPEAKVSGLDTRTPHPESETHPERSANEELWKRKGGGGGGGRGGGGGSSGGGNSGSGSGSGGSTGGSGGSTGGGRGGTGGTGGGRGTPNSGGVSGQGNPRFGGAYAGGAAQPYNPRRNPRSPSGLVPGLLAGAALGSLAFIGFSYLHNSREVYVYPYKNEYNYFNATVGHNETKPVSCVCDPDKPCGCDEKPGDRSFFDSVIGNGSYEGLNHSIVDVAPNETTKKLTIFINGIEEGENSDENAGNSMMDLAKAAGWWPAATMAMALAFIM